MGSLPLAPPGKLPYVILQVLNLFRFLSGNSLLSVTTFCFHSYFFLCSKEFPEFNESSHQEMAPSSFSLCVCVLFYYHYTFSVIAVSFLGRKEISICRDILYYSLEKVSREWRLSINWSERQMMPLECSKENWGTKVVVVQSLGYFWFLATP